MSDDHFTVDGAVIEAWAEVNSFRSKGEGPSDRSTHGDRGNPSVGFRGRKRTNQIHGSTTDPESRSMRKGLGRGVKVCYAARALMEDRNGPWST
jgi:hypothetical protein